MSHTRSPCFVLLRSFRPCTIAEPVGTSCRRVPRVQFLGSACSRLESAPGHSDSEPCHGAGPASAVGE